MYTVHLMRGGAPDKANIEVDGYKLIKHNHRNLVDYSMEEISEICGKGEYILPADEGDIKYANRIDTKYHKYIILPQTKDGIINSNLIEKDSSIYWNLVEGKSLLRHVAYKPFKRYSINEFTILINNGNIFKNCALKTTTGSGSRGIFIANEEAYNLGIWNYHKEASKENLKSFLSFAEEEYTRTEASIMVQELVPILLTKVNVDFVIRNGKLITYKWDLPEHGSNFTNWNWLKVVHNEWTDLVMKEIESYLTGIGITDALMNFEAYQDVKDDLDKSMLYMIEFNWRYSNSNFEAFAFGDDLVKDYLECRPFSYPHGETAVIRSWKAVKESDLINYESHS